MKFLPDIGHGNSWPDRRNDDDTNQTKPYTNVQTNRANSLGLLMQKCILCGAETQFLFSARDHARPDDSKERVLNWCNQCDFGRLGGEFSPAEVSTFYPEDYYTHSNSSMAQPKLSLIDRLRVHVAWRFDSGRDFSPDEIFNRKGVVCDLGCGSGHALRLFKAIGYQTVGVDPDPMARSVAGDAGDIFDGTAEELPSGFSKRRFDVVLMSHALEHCIDPKKAMSNAKNILAKDGTLVIEVPNNNAAGFSLFGPSWPWTDIPRHLNFFTDHSLEILLRQTGFRVFKTIYVGYTIQFLPSWILKQQDIWKQIGKGRAPNFDRAAWALLVRTAISQDRRKYASIRLHARHA